MRRGVLHHVLVATVVAVLVGCVGRSDEQDGGCASRNTDAHDLQGVFDAMASSSASASPSSSASGPTRPPARERARVPGPCVASSGTPAEAARRLGKRPACRRARVLEHQAEGRVPRYACVFEPSRIAETSPLPLVVFLHGAYDDPTAVHRQTRFRRRDHELDLTGDPDHPGFITLAPQARRIEASLRWDVDHVDRDNADIVAIRAFVAALVDEGIVDRRQIYAVGASRGATMANLYAYLHPEEVVAFGGFAAAPAYVWRCGASAPPPPAAMLYRACDAEVPCADIERWLQARERTGAATMSWRLGGASNLEPSCSLSERGCSVRIGKANHRRWPKRREVDLLEYLSRFSFRGPP
ncbi:MAG: PHB depolymerase family esterase [Myxococcota bacterium]